MKRLEQRVADQLRAGEIADRPASVARELLDNALDAGATRIAVSITGGGLREVTVADNGCGIAAGDVAMAFERYTTSKAGGAAYPGSGTLGFRGEALAAIAAVAQVICVTRATGADEAVELRVAGGEVQSTAIAAREYGTTVSVRNLFY
ncbi:DNA mismatch repair protein MutL, partial [Kouleothrix aurantiaca]